jgi:hypothetical protein
VGGRGRGAGGQNNIYNISKCKNNKIKKINNKKDQLLYINKKGWVDVFSNV